MEIEEKFARVLAESHGLRDNAPIEVVKPWMRDARLAAGFFEGYYGNELARLREKLSDALAAGGNHKSDCAVYNAPAFEPGPCDCGASLTPPTESGAGAREDALPDIEEEGERIVSETWKHPSGMFVWTDVVGAVQTAIAAERARHTSTEQMREALNKAREFAVLFIAFDGRDRNTDRMDRTLDEMRNLAVETDECIRQALGGNHD